MVKRFLHSLSIFDRRGWEVLQRAAELLVLSLVLLSILFFFLLYSSTNYGNINIHQF